MAAPRPGNSLAAAVLAYVDDIRSGSFASSEEGELLAALEQDARSAMGSEPAEQWEPVAWEQVTVGWEIEVTFPDDEHAAAIVRGTVSHIGLSCCYLRDVIEVPLNLPGVAIRRRVRPVMAEPAAPAVVRHAGRLLAHVDWSATPHANPSSGLTWVLLSGPTVGHRNVWCTWADVLALDPATDPVLVDLGGGE